MLWTATWSLFFKASVGSFCNMFLLYFYETFGPFCYLKHLEKPVWQKIAHLLPNSDKNTLNLQIMILPTIHPPHHFPAKVATSKSCCSSSMVWLQGASPSRVSTNPSHGLKRKTPTPQQASSFPFPQKTNLHPKKKNWEMLSKPGISASSCLCEGRDSGFRDGSGAASVLGKKNVRAWIAPLVLILSKNTTCEDLWCFNLFGTHKQNSWRRLYYDIHPYLGWLEVKLPRVEGELYGRQEGS